MNRKTKLITYVALLSAISIVISEFKIPLGVAHLKLDPSLIPSLIGGLLLGPVVGVLIELIKNSISVLGTSSAGIGELINFLVAVSVILPITFIYRKNYSNKNYIIGAVLSMVSIITVGAICNYILTPPYLAVLGRDAPTHAEIMAFVASSVGLNLTKGLVTLIPVFLMLPVLKKNIKE